MQANFMVYVFFGIFIWGVLWIFLYLLLKHLKGTIKIVLPQKNYQFGEEVSGHIHLHAKKHISSHHLGVSLIGMEKVHSYTDKWRKTRTVEAFRKEFDIQGPTQYLAWMKKDIDIKIHIPKFSEFPDHLQEIIESRNIEKKSFLRHYSRSFRSRKIMWKLRVDLQAEGIDLTSRETIHLSIPLTI